MLNRKAQVEITFNWVYILIAGAVILLFFVGIAVKEKASAQQSLGQDLVNTMDSIFTGAGVSEKTKNFIDIGGLAEYTLYFNCQDGITQYGLKDTSARSENNIDAIFAPSELKAPQLITWSLPYLLPYKVMDFLYISSSNTRYYLYSNNQKFVNEFMNATAGFNRDYLLTPEQYNQIDPQKNFHTRIIDFTGQLIKQNAPLPSKLRSLDDSAISGLVIEENQAKEKKVTYYQKQGLVWKKQNLKPLSIISLSNERDAALYAAIFAANDQMYQCTMKKAFKRLGYVTSVYQGKTQSITSFYQTHPELQFTKSCLSYYKDSSPNIQTSIESLHNTIPTCLQDPTFSLCQAMLDGASGIQIANTYLAEQGDCVPLY